MTTLVPATPGTVGYYVHDERQVWLTRHVLAYELRQDGAETYWAERFGSEPGLMGPDSLASPGWRYNGLGHIDDPAEMGDYERVTAWTEEGR